MSFGEKLRQEREARGIRLRTISDTTKISPSHLQALEANRFDDLPGGVFNRGFVRAYAECIGVDPVDMLAAYDAEARDQARHREELPIAAGGSGVTSAAFVDASPGVGGAAVRRRLTGGLVAAGALLVLSAAFLLLVRTGVIGLPRTGGDPTPAIQESRAIPSVPGKAQEAASEADAGPAPGAAAPGSSGSLAAVEPRAVTPESAPHVSAAARPEKEAPAHPSPDSPAASTPGTPPPSPVAGAEPLPGGAAAGIAVSESGIGGAVEDRMLEDRRISYRPGERVWFWTVVTGGGPGESIRHVWRHEGTLVSSVEIDLGGPYWRGYSYQTMFPGLEGHWTVDAVDSQERVLASASFTCASPEAP